jgi:hypothetical protein
MFWCRRNAKIPRTGSPLKDYLISNSFKKEVSVFLFHLTVWSQVHYLIHKVVVHPYLKEHFPSADESMQSGEMNGGPKKGSSSRKEGWKKICKFMQILLHSLYWPPPHRKTWWKGIGFD